MDEGKENGINPLFLLKRGGRQTNIQDQGVARAQRVCSTLCYLLADYWRFLASVSVPLSLSPPTCVCVCVSPKPLPLFKDSIFTISLPSQIIFLSYFIYC